MQEASIDGKLLDFSYKYPFSKEAKELVNSFNAKFEERYLAEGKIRLEEALNSGSIKFMRTNLSSVKKAYLFSYVYARMLASALNSRSMLDKYIRAEGERIVEAMLDKPEEILAVSSALKVSIRQSDGEFSVKFTEFLKHAESAGLSLIKQQLKAGIVYMSNDIAARLLGGAAKAEVSKNLPIKMSMLPREVISAAASVNVPLRRSISPVADPGRYAWVGKLLSTPIGDIRHRTVNLILAPYMVNVKGLGEEGAVRAIMDYISRCKEIDPNTNVNESYIRYQCRYAKGKGMRPLSLEKAKELLAGQVDL